jgi:hypothetical protein
MDNIGVDDVNTSLVAAHTEVDGQVREFKKSYVEKKRINMPTDAGQRQPRH